MPAIYGLIRLDGAPVDADELRVMGDAIVYWGEGRAAWRRDAAGLGEIGGGSPILLPDGTVVIAAARLDNRDDLLRVLGLANGDDDAHIVASSFQRWGRNAPLHLYGDWAFAAWNPIDRRLFLARDHYGTSSLYYHRGSRTFAFASNRKALFALPHVKRELDARNLARYFGNRTAEDGGTLHRDIFRLPPAHRLTLTSDSFRIDRYWKLEDVPEIRLPSDDAYVERFLELYGAAVHARLRSSRAVGTTLSSGLDSGSVTALAARELNARGERLPAFTSVLLDSQSITAEWPLAHAVAERCGNVDHHAVQSERMTSLEVLDESLRLHDEPVFMARHLFWTFGLLGAAREAGCGALLIAHMGNGGGSWTGIVSRRRWFRPRRSARGRSARMAILLPKAHPFGTFWSEMAAGHRIDVRDPTADVRLLEFCLGIPDDQFARPPHDRWLMRRAVEGLLPPQVQWNTTHGRPGADLPLRLRADAASIDEGIAEIAASPLANEHLDVPRIFDRWTTLRGDLGGDALLVAADLVRDLLVGRFLARGF